MITSEAVQLARLVTALDSAGAINDELRDVLEATAGITPDRIASIVAYSRELCDETAPQTNAHPLELISREQAEAWGGRHLSEDDLACLDDAIPNSSIPDAIGTIVYHLDPDHPAFAFDDADDDPRTGVTEVDATDDREDKLIPVAMRAGTPWRCACLWDNQATDTRCGGCGLPPRFEEH